MSYHLAHSVATSVVNTVYVVFLGLLIRITLLSPAGETLFGKVELTSENSPFAIALLGYYFFAWFSWNAVFAKESTIADTALALYLLGIMSLGVAFVVIVTPSMLDQPTPLVAFLVYGCLCFQDDMWVLRKGLKHGNEVERTKFVTCRYILGATKFGFLIGICLCLIAVVVRPDVAAQAVPMSRWVVIVFCVLKVIDYLILTRWKPAQAVLS